MYLATQDAPKGNKTWRREKSAYEKVRRAELQYGVKLRKIARAVGDIVSAFPLGTQASLAKIDSLLRKYAELIEPWAQVTAASMLADVSFREEAHWNELANSMGTALRAEMRKAPTGEILKALQAEQVKLITSIPLKAAQRVHKLTMEGMISGARYEEIRDDLLRTTHVTESRATLIARTEVGRASTNLTQARATYVGSEGYIWRTSKDLDVRDSHRKLEGTFHKWSEPPLCDAPNYHAHPGAIFNCFPGNTLVDLRQEPTAIIRGWYKGPLVAFLVDDRLIEATPNHPILTARGWVPAGLLDETDDLIQMLGKRSCSIVDNVNSETIRFEDLYKALVPTIKPQVVDKLDLYGDILDNDIQIVRLERDLPFYLQSYFGQGVGHEMVASTDRGVCAGRIKRSFSQIDESLRAGFADLIAAFLFGGFGKSDFVALADGAQSYAIAHKQFTNSPVAGFETDGKFWGAYSRFVELADFLFGEINPFIPSGRNMFGDANSQFLQMPTKDIASDASDGRRLFKQLASKHQISRLSNKSFRDFSGHVFTMETKRGYYGVSPLAIASKNCRCWPEIVIPDIYRLKGSR